MPDKWDSMSLVTKTMVANMNAYEDTGTKAWDARIMLRDLAYQIGGIQKIDMQLNNERHKQGKSERALLAEMEMELAEVIAGALFVAHELKLDVNKGFQRMLEGDEEKSKNVNKNEKNEKMPTVKYKCNETGKMKTKTFPYNAVGKAQADSFKKSHGGKIKNNPGYGMEKTTNSGY